jgi:Flp pilus assembly protein TadG
MFYYRRMSGSCFIEIIPAAFIMIVLLGLGVHLALVFLGFSVVDLAARDAARAAATQPAAAQAQIVAISQLLAHPTDGKLITTPILTNFIYNDYVGNPPVNTAPFVQCTVSSNVNLPGKVSFYGVTLFNTLTISRTYLFPIIKAKFYG